MNIISSILVIRLLYLFQMFCKALRELSETCGVQGSTLQTVENHIRSIYSVEVSAVIDMCKPY